MPAYVFRYGNKNGPWTVDYDDGPGWKIASRHAADTHCGTLRTLGVHAGEHLCIFVVEELADGGFAIVCATHPEHLRHATPLQGLLLKASKKRN
jgi:hypothetical protein